jgi:hypothetical protein
MSAPLEAGALPNSQSPTPEGKVTISNVAKIVLIDTDYKCVAALILGHRRAHTFSRISASVLSTAGLADIPGRGAIRKEGAAMTDLLLKPAPDVALTATKSLLTIGSLVASCCPMFHRPTGHGCGPWITSSIKVASRHTVMKPRESTPCRRSRGAGTSLTVKPELMQRPGGCKPI